MLHCLLGEGNSGGGGRGRGGWLATSYTDGEAGEYLGYVSAWKDVTYVTVQLLLQRPAHLVDRESGGRVLDLDTQLR